MRIFAVLSLCHAQHYSAVDLDEQPVRGYPRLELNEGTVIGVEYDNFDVYRAVPYGSARRFEMAEPVTPFEFVNSTASGPTCFQTSNFFSNKDVMDRPEMSIGEFASKGLVLKISNINTEFYIQY